MTLKLFKIEILSNDLPPDPITESMLPYDVVDEKDTTATLTNTVSINAHQYGFK